MLSFSTITKEVPFVEVTGYGILRVLGDTLGRWQRSNNLFIFTLKRISSKSLVKAKFNSITSNCFNCDYFYQKSGVMFVGIVLLNFQKLNF